MCLLSNFLTTKLLACVLVYHVALAAEPTCHIYNVVSNKLIRPENSPATLLKINFEVSARQYNLSNHLFSLDIRNPDVTIDREMTGSRLDLTRCPSNIIPASRALQPFLAVYNEKTGLLSHIHVDKSEVEVDANVQFFVASLLQINLATISKDIKNPKTSDDEILFGECPLTYEVKRENDPPGTNLRVVKAANLASCKDVKQCRRARCKSEQCETKVEIDAPAHATYQLREDDGIYTIDYILFNGTYLLNPSNRAIRKTRLDLDIEITLSRIEPCNTPLVVPAFINVNATKLTRMQLRPVDESLLQKRENDKLSDIREAYRSLAVGGDLTNIYQDLYERALKCWQLVN